MVVSLTLNLSRIVLIARAPDQFIMIVIQSIQREGKAEQFDAL